MVGYELGPHQLCFGHALGYCQCSPSRNLGLDSPPLINLCKRVWCMESVHTHGGTGMSSGLDIRNTFPAMIVPLWTKIIHFWHLREKVVFKVERGPTHYQFSMKKYSFRYLPIGQIFAKSHFFPLKFKKFWETTVIVSISLGLSFSVFLTAFVMYHQAQKTLDVNLHFDTKHINYCSGYLLTCYVNATNSYLHFCCFAGDVVLFQNFFYFLLFLCVPLLS